jgi:hypothetical protein
MVPLTLRNSLGHERRAVSAVSEAVMKIRHQFRGTLQHFAMVSVASITVFYGVGCRIKATECQTCRSSPPLPISSQS